MTQMTTLTGEILWDAVANSVDDLGVCLRSQFGSSEPLERLLELQEMLEEVVAQASQAPQQVTGPLRARYRGLIADTFRVLEIIEKLRLTHDTCVKKVCGAINDLLITLEYLKEGGKHRFCAESAATGRQVELILSRSRIK
jgi:hypothetical protein